MLCFVCFFVQAEDGIRDLVRSRGLGDVYKRQVEMCAQTFFRNVNDAEIKFMDKICDDLFLRTYTPVSYTHLTLPTIYSV